MPWISANLASVMGDAVAKAQAAVADAQKSVANLNSQVNALAGTLTSATSALTGNKSMLDAMMESGFYMIPLSPALGAWNTRLAAAANEPPNAGYCAGIATIIISADPEALASSFEKMKAALKKPVDDAKAFIDATDFSDFEPELPELPEIPELTAPDWDDKFSADEWSSATLGDVFGGAAEGLSRASSALGKQVKSALATKNQLNKALTGLSGGLSRANGFLADLSATGVYNIMLPPGAGGYLSRLQAETGAPPSDSGMYSAGFVCIAVAGGSSQLTAKFTTLSNIIGG